MTIHGAEWREIPETAMCLKECLRRLKRQLTGLEWSVLLIRKQSKCWKKWLPSLSLVSPIEIFLQRVHVILQITTGETQFKWSVTLILVLNSESKVVVLMKGQLLWRLHEHLYVPGGRSADNDYSLNQRISQLSVPLESRDCVKIEAVSGWLCKILKFLWMMCLTRKLMGWNINLNNILSSFIFFSRFGGLM